MDAIEPGKYKEFWATYSYIDKENDVEQYKQISFFEKKELEAWYRKAKKNKCIKGITLFKRKVIYEDFKRIEL